MEINTGTFCCFIFANLLADIEKSSKFWISIPVRIARRKSVHAGRSVENYCPPFSVNCLYNNPHYNDINYR